MLVSGNHIAQVIRQQRSDMARDDLLGQHLRPRGAPSHLNKHRREKQKSNNTGCHCPRSPAFKPIPPDPSGVRLTRKQLCTKSLLQLFRELEVLHVSSYRVVHLLILVALGATCRAISHVAFELCAGDYIELFIDVRVEELTQLLTVHRPASASVLLSIV